MIVAMKSGATRENVASVMDLVNGYGLNALDLPGGERTAIGIASSIPPDLREPLARMLESLDGVDHIVHVSRTYKLASREFQSADSLVQVKDVVFGGKEVIVAAGPCTIESYDQLLLAAETVKAAGGRVLRGGAFKPRTSPYSFQGLGLDGLKMLKRVGEEVGLVTITEVIDQHDLADVVDHADILQIGARNMQNYPLLIAIGQSKHPVLLKRGPSATIDEWLLAAEYIMSHGNPNVILCERGIHPLDKEHVRYTLDLSAVPVAKLLSHLPVIVDPSHASGYSRYIPAMSRAAIAAGADGLIVEIHPNPPKAVCDGAGSLNLEAFTSMMDSIRAVANAVGRSISSM